MRLLMSYDWPGNVRQRFAAIESAAIDAQGGRRIEAQHLPQVVREFGERAADLRYRATSSDEERAMIQAALEACDGVLSRAAERLGMGRTTLWRKLKQYGLGT